MSRAVAPLIERVYDSGMEAVRDRLHGEVNALAGQLNVVNASLTRVCAELLETGSWEQGGVTTPSGFLQWQMGLSPARADDVVRVARRRAEFPVLMAAFDRGEFSLEQIVAAIGAPAWADALLYDFVQIATVTKIRRAMRSNMFEGDPDEPDPDPAPVRDRVSFGVRNGRWRLSGELGIDDGRRVEAALTEARDRIFHDDGDDAATWPAALVEVAERSLGSVESMSRRDRYRTWLHLDVTGGDATTTDGWRIPMAVRDRVLCDGVVQPVWEADGVPFSVGRARHIVPDRTRRIVERRDRGCRVPGCNADRFVEIHHIIHWINGGTTDTWNLVSLCPRHHKMHHHGRLGITGNADHFDQLVFTDARGDPIAHSGSPAPPDTTPPPPTTAYDPPLAERFDWNWIGLGWIHPNALIKRRADLDAHYQRLTNDPTFAA